LINHHFSWKELVPIVKEMKAQFPDLWIGVNFLGLSSAAMFKVIKENDLDVQGVWSDNAEILETLPADQQVAAAKIKEVKEATGFTGLYFGGTSFKYQREVTDVKTAAAIAAQYMDVVTTSGPGTGKSADIEKVKLMKEGCQDHPLAIASGVTPENVDGFLPYIEFCLVATGISVNFENLSFPKAKALIAKVQQSN